MGITACRARLLLRAKQEGVDFGSTLTLGRQGCHFTASEWKRLAEDFGLSGTEGPEALRFGGYADALFRSHLGARSLGFMDYSDYQGADIVHDLNAPIPGDMESAWDVVIDGGTLEHVFNFPVAIANCMRLLKTGGSLFIFSMANNHCGHGFYQFSPELFFRIFRAENGFELKSAILVRHPFPGAELGGSQDCFQVTDPAILRRRTSLVTRSPLGIMVHAVKTAHVPPFRVSPQQSDYAAEWKRDHGDAKRENGRRSLWRTAWEKLPFAIRRRAAGYRQLWKYSLERDKEAYRPWP